MTPSKSIEEYILGYVRKCGGIEKVEQVIDAFKAILSEGEVSAAAYLRRIAQRPDGAKQLLVTALLGNTLAAMTYHAKKGVK